MSVAPGDVLVVGGGIVGLSVARFLVRRGMSVTVVARDPIDEGASVGNAGQAAFGHAPLPRPGLALNAVKWMFNGASPLYIPPRLDPALIGWLWNFRRACGRRQFDRNMEFLAACGLEAGALLVELVEEEHLDIEYRREGRLEVFRGASALETANDEADVLRRHGYAVERLDGNALRARDPAFRDAVAGAIDFGDSMTVAPHELMPALAAALAAHGTTIRTGQGVQAVEATGGRARGVTLEGGERIEADVVVLAAGIWTMALAERAGVRVPMQAGKGYHLELPRPEPCVGTACVLAERFVAVTPLRDRLRLAGTLEFTGINERMHDRRVQRLREGAELYLRGIDAGDGEVHRWCGLRPCTADGLPAVGWAPGVDGLFIATGHAMMGLTLGPLTGAYAARMIMGEPVPEASLLSPARFAVR